jgi:AcrR family transcriptional regulator
VVQEGSLARRHDDAPGLPRGRSSLPADEVRAKQRERLLHATVAAVAAAGYHNITVADIVRGARVSKAAFYAHFRDKEDCFLATTAYGGNLMVDAVVGATRSLPATAPAAEILRVACRRFLRFLADEPAFARVFYVDMPAAGAGAVDRLDAAQHRFAELNRTWHRHALSRHPDWPTVPYDAYLALAGATTELVSVRVRHDRAAELPALEDTLVALHLAVLAGRTWGA